MHGKYITASIIHRNKFKQLQHKCKEMGIEIYEKDIDIHTLYITKHNIKIGGWARMDYSSDNILRDICYINDDTIPLINVMCFDIECPYYPW